MKNANSQEKIKIVVATHKKYQMPTELMYVPVQVGAEGKALIGYTPDNTGDNISAKNANYCELTGLYWLWKNAMDDADAIGLVHYRRHFTQKKSKDKWDCIATEEQVRAMLEKAPIILPKKRNYFIETNYSQYAHAHHAIDLDTAREIFSEKYPEYLHAYDSVMKRTKGHRFNMFIMEKRYAEEYCSWLFDILFELEKRLDITKYSVNDARVFGFVGERLLDVWLEKNGYEHVELHAVFMEDEHWLSKGVNFLKRKLAGKR